MSPRLLVLVAVIAAILLLCCAGFLFSASRNTPSSPGSSDDELAKILSRGRLIIATDANYPPNSDLVPGANRSPQTSCLRNEYTAAELTGYNIAVASEIAKRLGVEPCFVLPTRTEIISGTWADRWDIHIGSMAITRERMKALYFTQPYYAGPVVLFVHKNNTAYSAAGDLSGKKIGVCAGCILEQYLEGTLDLPGQKIPFAVHNATIIAYDNEANALADLAAGDGAKLDAVLTNGPLGDDAIRNGMPLRSLAEPVFFDFDGAAIDRKSGRDPVPFVRNVSGIIRQMEQDGTLRELSRKYYGGDYVSNVRYFNATAIDPLFVN